MKYSDIQCFTTPNSTDQSKVESLKKSIKDNGWQGAPLLALEGLGVLLTGSHRMEALRQLLDEDWDFDADVLGDIAEPVDDIVDAYCLANDCTIDNIDLSWLSTVFEGTWVEDYKDELNEW